MQRDWRDTKGEDGHRASGRYIMIAGPILIASLSLLTVH